MCRNPIFLTRTSKHLCVMTVPLCSVPRPSRSDEPAAYDARWKLPDAPHARRRHPGRLRLGLHRLTQSQIAKRVVQTKRERSVWRQSVCVTEQEGWTWGVCMPVTEGRLERDTWKIVQVLFIMTWKRLLCSWCFYETKTNKKKRYYFEDNHIY